jgi:hypothetical protein
MYELSMRMYVLIWRGGFLKPECFSFNCFQVFSLVYIFAQHNYEL